MMTLFVCASNKLHEHHGETYDAVVEVSSEPTVETIDVDANRIMAAIIGLHNEQAGAADQTVNCLLHGPVPYVAIIRNLQIIMKQSHRIDIVLSSDGPIEPEVTDPETIAVLKKLG